jgi:stage VI sporulation protein D
LSNEQDIFSFDLNESLYFEKGQEVSQMLGISLDPEISIQSFNEYVSIRGVIELHGEYEKSTENNEARNESLDLNENHSRRYLEKVDNIDDHLVEFSHRFPVEISVPSYRVADVNDITVNVASFDYEISEENQLKLTSTIDIHGISNQTTDPMNDTERIEGNTDTLDETFEFEIKKEVLEQEAEGDERNTEPEEVVEKAKENEEEIDDKDRWKYKQTQSFEEFFKVDESLENEEQNNMGEENVASESEIEVQEDTGEAQQPDRQTSYLANMFGGNEAEEEGKYAQMRIYIVQDKETLESISERYQIPKLQLLNMNRLDGDDLSKGQLLAIPTKKEDKT